MTRPVRAPQSSRRAHSSPSEPMNTPSSPCSNACRIHPGLSPLLHGTLIVETCAGQCMCLLPARSMPGSEMLFVEKTRILGLNAVSTMVVTAGSLGLAKEELQVACVVDPTQELMTHLLEPRGQGLP